MSEKGGSHNGRQNANRDSSADASVQEVTKRIFNGNEQCTRSTSIREWNWDAIEPSNYPSNNRSKDSKTKRAMEKPPFSEHAQGSTSNKPSVTLSSKRCHYEANYNYKSKRRKTNPSFHTHHTEIAPEESEDHISVDLNRGQQSHSEHHRDSSNMLLNFPGFVSLPGLSPEKQDSIKDEYGQEPPFMMKKERKFNNHKVNKLLHETNKNIMTDLQAEYQYPAFPDTLSSNAPSHDGTIQTKCRTCPEPVLNKLRRDVVTRSSVFEFTES